MLGCGDMDFNSARILIVGDVMLDRYIYGDVRRVSPEAPVPVLNVEGDDSSIGAAANCARNITALGGSVSLISVVGDDYHGGCILSKVAEDRKITPYIFREHGRASTVKTRYLCDNHQMLRVDTEDTRDIGNSLQERIISMISEEASSHDAVIFSDYNKGVLTPNILRHGIKACSNIPVIVDPKKSDWAVYSGATVITPNLNEWFIASGRDYDCESVRKKSVDENIENILVTRSKFGMTLVNESGHTDIPAVAKHIIDVTGAGDTAVAVLALGIATGMALVDAAILANKGAGIVVGKPKTATLGMEELLA